MAGSTPGPWHLEYDWARDTEFPIDTCPSRIVDNHGAPIVDFTGGSDVTEDNAVLLTAAPLLFDAASAALAHIMGLTATGFDGLTAEQVADMLQGAISAAIGEH